MKSFQFFSIDQAIRTGLLSLGICLLLFVPCSAAKQKSLQLPWGQLDQVITGHKVQTVLPDGTALKGRVLAILPEGLKLKVGETSNRADYPKGENLIPKNQVKVLRFTEYKGSWRGFGVAIGAGATVVPAGMVAVHSSNEGWEGAAAIIPAVVAGGAVAGYFAGRSADKTVVTVTVAPESTQPTPE